MTGRRAVVGVLPAIGWLSLLLAPGISGCSREIDPVDDPQDAIAILTTTTDEEGFARVVDSRGAAVMELDAHDASGTPLADIDVFHLPGGETSLVGFCAPRSGAPAGLFLLFADSKDEPPDTPFAAFVLDTLHATRGRLYNSSVDTFTPHQVPTIQTASPIEDLDAVLAVAESAPDLSAGPDVSLVELHGALAGDKRAFILEKAAMDCLAGTCRLLVRVSRLAAYSAHQDDRYRYRRFHDARTDFILPLGLSAPVIISNPGHWVQLLPDLESVEGFVDCAPSVLQTEGGGLELRFNGSLVADPGFEIGADSAMQGTRFHSGPLTLAHGANVIEVSAYVSRANRGLETPADGMAGYDHVTVYRVGP